jgi:hypothetical protein
MWWDCLFLEDLEMKKTLVAIALTIAVFGAGAASLFFMPTDH